VSFYESWLIYDRGTGDSLDGEAWSNYSVTLKISSAVPTVLILMLLGLFMLECYRRIVTITSAPVGTMLIRSRRWPVCALGDTGQQLVLG